MIDVMLLCASLLVYGPLETTAHKGRCHAPAANETLARKSELPPVRRAGSVNQIPETSASGHHKRHPVKRLTFRRSVSKHALALRARCGSQRAVWYWSKKHHRRRYRCR